jgi:hypothetical protein
MDAAYLAAMEGLRDPQARLRDSQSGTVLMACDFSRLRLASRLHKGSREGELNMMLKALITTLVLGTSSVAMARPVAPNYQPTPVYQPYRPAPVYRAPAHRSSWVTLGSVNHIANGEMSFWMGRTMNERFSTLKLKSGAGKSLIQRVLIQFANGRTQTVDVNQYLNASNPTITIDLQGRERAISKVTVIGRNARQSSFSVLAG